jgi:hypothetical protein
MTNIAWAAEQKSLDAITSDRRARAVKANATKAALDEEEAKVRGQAAVVWAATIVICICRTSSSGGLAKPPVRLRRDTSCRLWHSSKKTTARPCQGQGTPSCLRATTADSIPILLGA